MLESARPLVSSDPVRVATAVAAVVVFGARSANLIVEQQDVITALLLVVPVVLGGDRSPGRVEPPILASDLTGHATGSLMTTATLTPTTSLVSPVFG